MRMIMENLDLNFILANSELNLSMSSLVRAQEEGTAGYCFSAATVAQTRRPLV